MRAFISPCIHTDVRQAVPLVTDPGVETPDYSAPRIGVGVLREWIVSNRCVVTMLSAFPEADPGSPRDGAGGSPDSHIAISLYSATSSTCRYLMPLRSIQYRPRL